MVRRNETWWNGRVERALARPGERELLAIALLLLGSRELRGTIDALCRALSGAAREAQEGEERRA